MNNRRRTAAQIRRERIEINLWITAISASYALTFLLGFFACHAMR